MGRLLVLLLIIALVAIIVVKLVKGRAGGTPASARRDERVPDGEAKLVRCVRCGAYVPRGETLPAPDGPRCGDPACAP